MDFLEEDEEDDDLSVLEGELWNGYSQLTLGDTTLTMDTIQNIIHQRFDQHVGDALEEVHLSQVTFDSDLTFNTFALALQELPTLERLTWHSSLSLPRWNALTNGWNTGLLVEFDVEWSLLSATTVGNEETATSMMKQIFADFFRLTDQKLVLRIKQECDREDVQTIFAGLQAGRQAKVQHGSFANVALSVYAQFSSETFPTWVDEICKQPKLISSFYVWSMEFTPQSIACLEKMLTNNALTLANLFFLDPSVTAHLSKSTLEQLTNALAKNEFLERLSLRSIADASHAVWHALFSALRQNTTLEHLEINTAELNDGATLVSPLADELPHMQGLRVLETRWCAGMSDVIMPGLRANVSLHDIVLDGLGRNPADEDALRACLTRNRLYHEMKFVRHNDPDLYDTLSFLASGNLNQTGSALYHIIRCTLLPHLLPSWSLAALYGARQRGAKRKRPQEEGETPN